MPTRCLIFYWKPDSGGEIHGALDLESLDDIGANLDRHVVVRLEEERTQSASGQRSQPRYRLLSIEPSQGTFGKSQICADLDRENCQTLPIGMVLSLNTGAPVSAWAHPGGWTKGSYPMAFSTNVACARDRPPLKSGHCWDSPEILPCHHPA